ncbi:hypothetical protein CDEST_15147 [Colletotrichum destructivum]|uniref:Uncharacterized protein n=1 Tax=Colletotrichum destructivum TaxID=34406 RepID=A0AAX4J3J1_9PEZI|nr:hypothetical protein CDEST_15147 [Colletotrichum destructivum]
MEDTSISAAMPRRRFLVDCSPHLSCQLRPSIPRASRQIRKPSPKRTNSPSLHRGSYTHGRTPFDLSSVYMRVRRPSMSGQDDEQGGQKDRAACLRRTAARNRGRLLTAEGGSSSPESYVPRRWKATNKIS